MIEHRVQIHDRHQVEVKLAYKLDDFAQARSYDVSTYLFLPGSLGITPATYTKKTFFNNLMNYIRLKTPEVLLRDIHGRAGGPLQKLDVSFDLLASRPSRETERACAYQLKMFCSILKSALRDHVGALDKRTSAADHENLVDEFIKHVREVTHRFRLLRNVINVPSVPDRFFSKYLFADEYISLLIETRSYELLEALESRENGNLEGRKAHLLSLIRDEIQYRKDNGYPSIPESSGDNEVLLFRMSVLKKWVERVLFLGTHTTREGKVMKQTLFMIAAGLSMVFATAVAFFVQKTYGSLTFPFFVALVVSYMFKDRMKELLRNVFDTGISRVFFDRLTHVYRDDQGAERIGTIKESFGFVSERGIPPGVRKLRSRDHITEIENGWLGESVIVHRKRIKLLPSWFDRIQGDYPIEGIADILRLDISGFLSRMDEPSKTLWILDGDGYRRVSGQRVYHINMVVQCRSGESDVLRRFRMVLNKEGIKRIEAIQTTGA